MIRRGFIEANESDSRKFERSRDGRTMSINVKMALFAFLTVNTK
jgi:hypothetical protein